MERAAMQKLKGEQLPDPAVRQVIRHQGKVGGLEEGIGDVPVKVQSGHEGPRSTQMSVPRMPERGPEPPSRADLAAMLSLVPDGDLDSVAEKMTKALEHVRTGEITTATRSVEIDGVKVELEPVAVK
jgi:hypothetical protein